MVQPIDLSQASISQAPISLSSSEAAERSLRIQLAAAYRLIDKFRMSDLVDTHISVRLPETDGHFLINPYGLMFHEITASSLLKVDLEGNLVDRSEWSANPAGFVIHSAVYGARPDIHCVLHTHSRYGMAVSMLECGLLPVSQFALQFYDRVAYHDYEGVSLDLDERERLVQDLGNQPVMIMRNHGLLTAGSTVPEAFYLMFYLERSCEAQILAQSSGSKLVFPPPQVCEKSARQQDTKERGQLQWNPLMRMLDREDPSYRD